MQTQHNQAESSLRLLSIEKINTSDLQLEIEDNLPADAVSMSLEKDFYGQAEQQQQQQQIRRGQTTTLLEFPSKMSKDQEWREEIKNRIRERQEGGGGGSLTAATTASAKKTVKSNQAAESSLVINLKPKLAEKQSQKPKDVVAEALKRIERSRQKFENEELANNVLIKTSRSTVSESDSQKQSEAVNSTLTLVPPARKVLPTTEDGSSKNRDEKPLLSKTAQKGVFTVPLTVPTSGNAKPKSELVRESSINFDDLDDDATIAASLESIRVNSAKKSMLRDQELTERNLSANAAAGRQSNEDYAPLGPRFIAGLIDALLCAVCALAISHFAFSTVSANTGWLLTAVAFAVISFVYLTAALQLTDTTFGLRLFGILVVAAENGEVPTLRQTAIANAVYLLTLATGGIGFLTVFFSSEWRTLHDLLSGTVVVKE